jgi:hypothetical protein
MATQSARDKAIAAAKANQVKQAANQQIQSIQSDLNTQITAKVAVETQVASYNAQIAAATNPSQINALANEKSAKTTSLNASLSAKISADQLKIAAIKAAQKPLSKTDLAKYDKAGLKAGLVTITNITSPFISYNVGSVAEAYFTSRERFLLELDTANVSTGATKSVMDNSTNRPTIVTNAANLWKSAGAHKGMIQTYAPSIGKGGTFAQKGAEATIDNTLYGFQFLYNPGSILMSWQGTPQTDITMYTSGTEKFNAIGTGVTQSTVDFQIVINRMFDMKYYNADGTLKVGSAPDLYTPRQPTAQEQKDIYEKGTMYDIEYLLRTLLGFTMKSSLRNENTADMGFVSARPVELHLGNKLRYLVQIPNFSINHIFFNERMVPLMTTVHITASRIPDYGGPLVTGDNADPNATPPPPTKPAVNAGQRNG